MKLRTFLIVVLILFGMSTIGAQHYELVGPPGNGVLGIGMNKNNPDEIWTSSSTGGGVFFTLDGGETLDYIKLPVKDFHGYDLTVLPSGKKALYEHQAYYFLVDAVTRDYKILLGSNSRLLDITYNPLNENIFYAIKDAKELWRSNDAGENWSLIKNVSQGLGAIWISPNDTSNIYCYSENGLSKSTDSGKNWIEVADVVGEFGANTRPQVFVHPKNEDNIFIKTGLSSLVYSTDGGENFTTLEEHYGVITIAIDPDKSNVIYIRTDHGLYKSSDTGESWEALSDGSHSGFGGWSHGLVINPFNKDEIYMSTRFEGVIKTTNVGETWEMTNLCKEETENIILASKEKGVYLTGHGNEHSRVMKTSNDGKDWYHPNFDENPTLTSSVEGGHFIDFDPRNKNKGFLAARNNLYYTDDAGDNWQRTEHLSGAAIVFYHPYYPQIIFSHVVDNPSIENGVYISKNSGENWDKLSDVYFPNHFNFFRSDSSVVIGFVYDFQEYDFFIKKTTDLGKTWNYYNEGLIKEEGTTNRIMDVAARSDDPKTVYCAQMASGQIKGALSKSTDGGETWFQVDSTLNTLDSDVSVTSIWLDPENENRFYVGLNGHGQPFTDDYSEGGLYLTEDNGKSYEKLYDGEVNFIKADDYQPRTIYFGTNLGLMKLSDTVTVGVEDELEEGVIENYKLSQNYPNPFNPTTTIAYQIPRPGNVKIQLYDVLGREVRTLVDSYKTKGKYKITFNGSGLPSGVYIYRIKSGEFTASKKLVLMK